VLLAGLLVLAAADPVQAADPLITAPVAALSWMVSDPSIRIHDDRSRGEHDSWDLENSSRVTWEDKDFETVVRKVLDPSRPVFVYCQGGKRSAKAAAEMLKLGFNDVRDLQGGVNQWVETGNPPVKTKPQARP
jgi:rhodanese-related sulfurtransferase